jgi:hypothetical protein
MRRAGTPFGSPTGNVAVEVRPIFDGAAPFVPPNPSPTAVALPNPIEPGTTGLKTVYMLNTGTTTWTAEAGYRLGSQNPQDNSSWGFHRAPLTQVTPPGQSATFTMFYTAPAAAGTYNFQQRMLREGVAWFGQPTSNQVVTVLRDDAAFVSQTVPDAMLPGQETTVYVTLRNTGETTWRPAGGRPVRLGSQNPQDNFTWGLGRVELPLQVPPGALHTFGFIIRAPTAPGTYNFRWRMLREGVAWFGAHSVNKAIGVQPPPAAPSALVGSYDAPVARIRLGWTDNSVGEDGFHLQMSYAGSAWSDLSPSTVPGNATTWQSGPNPPGGSYRFRARAFRGGLFSPWSNEASLTVVPLPLVDGAAYVGQSVPGSMVGGQQYSVVVTVRNTGTTVWTPAAGHRLGSQNPQDNQVWGLGRVLLPGAVAPGDAVTLGFLVNAPANPGTYNFQWRMLREGVAWFGAPSANVAVGVQ